MSGVTVLVGRDVERALLVNCVEDLISGTGRAILLEGEPGIGKSALARATAMVAEQRSCHVFRSAADELGQALPLQPLLDALRVRDSADEPRLATILRLLSGELTGSGPDPVVAASEQMLTLMAELCSAAPTVLILDDLQWADLATINVWEWLTRSADRLPLLLIGAMRPVPRRDELLAVEHAVGPNGTIRLGGLPDTAVADLIGTVVGGKPGDDLLQLSDGAAGNPLYVTELMSTLVRTDRLTVTEAGVVEVTGGAVPDSLVAAISDRLDFLPHGVRAVLRAAALLGVEFLVSDLAIVLDRRIAELVSAIDEALAAGVLKEEGERLSFRHTLIRDSLYDDIAVPVRAAWHQDAAKMLAEAGVPIPRVARQLLRAIGSPSAGPLDESLLEWMVSAAPTLVAQAPRAAIDLLRQACGRSPVTTNRGAVLACRLADSLFRAGDSAGAEQVAAAAMPVITDLDLLVDLHWTMAQARAVMGKSGESLKALDRALSIQALTARQRARLLVLTARAYQDLGEVTVAGRVAAEALRTAEAADDQWAIGWSLHVLIILSMTRGDIAVRLLFERAFEIVGNDPSLTDLRLLMELSHAVALGDMDRFPDAIAAAEHVRQHADRAGSLIRLAQAQSALGQLLFDTGCWDDALTEIEVLPDEFKDPRVTCCDRGVAAVIAFHRGDPDTAREHLNIATSSATKIGSRAVASMTLGRSLDHEIAGEHSKALAAIAIVLTYNVEELQEIEDLLPEAARLAAHIDAVDIVADIASRTAKLAQRSQVPHRLAASAYCSGLLDDDPVQLIRAADRYTEANRPLQRANALEAAAIKFANRGERKSAKAAFNLANELYARLGADWDLTRLRAQYRSYGVRPVLQAGQRQARKGWSALTPTEAKVAWMVAQALSNREIAEQLTLSTRTIDTHVSHILAKLGARRRVEIAREAATLKQVPGQPSSQ